MAMAEENTTRSAMDEYGIQDHPNVKALFSVSVISMVGDGKSTCFWTDRWLHGQNIGDLAPTLFALVPKSLTKKWTVQEGLKNHIWVEDIRGSLQAHGLLKFLLLWDTLQDIQISPGCRTATTEHRPIWGFTLPNQHMKDIHGAVQFELSGRIWGI
jgi:hypothetical protein